MTYPNFDAIKIKLADHVAWLTIAHPPINLLDTILLSDLNTAAQLLAADDEVRVVVIQSADPDFFVAHADVTLIQGVTNRDPAEDPDASFVHHVTEQFRLMPKPTIGKLDGIARGGGLELLAALDMRFCSIKGTTVSQPEVAFGIIPGGGGCSRWPRLIGYARAMELMLSGADMDGATAEKYGIVNRAIKASKLDDFVEALATRLASFQPHAMALIKQVGQLQGTLEEALSAEHFAFLEAARHPTTAPLLQAFLDDGGQTREYELTGDF